MSILRNMLLDSKCEFSETLLAETCLLISRSGLSPFDPGEDPTLAEICALAVAREQLVKEHAALLVFYMKNPAKAFAPFDGGNTARAEMMAEAWAAVPGG